MFGMSYTMLQIPYGGLGVGRYDRRERAHETFGVPFNRGGVGSIPAVLIASFCYKKIGVNEQTGRVISEMQYKR